VSRPQFTLGSLFSGIGGLELGLEMTGAFQTVWQVEQSEYCRKVLARHWPNAQRFEDVRDVGRGNLATVDVICGGFPCQDVSHANPRGKGLDGDRSGLWFEYARIVGELRPQFVVVENVAALVNDGLDRVLGSLAFLGYDAEWSVVSACAVGAPHPRERVFVCAYANSVRLPRRSHKGNQREGRTRSEKQLSRLLPANPWLAVSEPRIDGVAHGLPDRVERSRALGNAVVPQCARVIGEWLLEIDAELSEGAA
jgi:DNA (cytosine-5)-methyltransferase 1